MDFKNRSKEHTVYALMFNGSPVYVGCCMNIKERELSHKRTKKFDYLIVIKTFSTKNEALICENGIIRFLSLFEGNQFLNSVFKDIVINKQFKEFSLNQKKESEVFNG